MTDVPKVCLVVDYQNIHLMAHQIWAPWGLPVHEALIHPLKFAEQVMAVRSIRQQDPLQQQALLTSVRVFRGAPSNKKQPYLYGISQRQQSAWTRDKRVEVTYRTLRYREKDVDVLVALTLMRAAQEPDVDVVILASHDSDLEPALEMAVDDGHAKIETAGWQGANVLRPKGRRRAGLGSSNKFDPITR